MTQAVFQNEISQLTPQMGISNERRQEVADALGDVLADAFRLFVNTQGLHWNVEGPMFYSVHKLTEDQYSDIGESLDAIAERIRALGMPAPESLTEFAERSNIDDLPKDVVLQKRIERLIGDYEESTVRLMRAVRIAEKFNDFKTADLLTERIGVYEENAWMLRATTA